MITNFSSSPHPNASGVVLLLEGSTVSLECAASGRECYQGKPTLTNLAILFNSGSLRSVANSTNISYSLESVKADSSHLRLKHVSRADNNNLDRLYCRLGRR